MGVVFVLVRDKKILMQQRDQNCKRFPFKWCIPGGTSEPGESSKETLLREVKEEFDLDIKFEECQYLMDRNNSLDQVYLCNINPDQKPQLHEGLRMQWMTIDEIEKLELGFNQEDVVLKLKQIL